MGGNPVRDIRVLWMYPYDSGSSSTRETPSSLGVLAWASVHECPPSKTRSPRIGEGRGASDTGDVDSDLQLSFLGGATTYQGERKFDVDIDWLTGRVAIVD